MASARKASQTQSKIQMLIYGDWFTGKSTLAMQIAYFKRPDGKPFRVLYVDPESGSIDDYVYELEENGVDTDNVYIYYTQSLTEVGQLIEKIKNNEDFYILNEDGEEDESLGVVLDADGEPFRADAIVIDGTSILNTTTKMGLEEFSKIRNKVKANKEGLTGDERLVKIEGSGIELRDYSKINNRGQAFVLDLAACGAHYIITARETDEKTNIKTADGQIASISTGKKIPEGFKSVGYNVKTVVRTFRDENDNVCAYVEKDRTHAHKDKVVLEDPQLLDWQVVIDRTAKNKSFTINNDMTRSVQVEKDLYSKDVLNSVGIKDEDTVTTSSKNESSIDELRAIAMEKKKALSPVAKQALKEKLESNNLPIAWKNVVDVNVMKQVLACFE